MKFIHNAIITTIIFTFIYGASKLPVKFDSLNPLLKALDDFELNDIVFSKLRGHNDVPLDTNIIIINIGFLNRDDIAKRLELLNSFNPKVIGIDVFFEDFHRDESDNNLSKVFASSHNLVFANALVRRNSTSIIYDSIKTSNYAFLNNANQGYVNLMTEDGKDVETVRGFAPRYKLGYGWIDAFSLECVKMFDKNKYQTFINRSNPEEIINYERNINYNTYMRLDLSQIDSSIDRSSIENKIVLLGFIGFYFNDSLFIRDKFFTPMNDKYAGKTLPDMYGVVIHANIISMILEKNYINIMPLKLNVFLTVIICFLNIIFLSWLFSKTINWYDEIAAVFSVIIIITILYSSIVIFHDHNYQFNTTNIILAFLLAPNINSTYYEILNKIKNKKLFKR